MAEKQDITQIMLLLDENLRADMSKAIKETMLRHSDSIKHRLIVGNILKGECDEMIADLLKIAENVSERYLLQNLQQIDDVLKMDPAAFDKYVETGEAIGLAYSIRYHLQKRKLYEAKASALALKGEKWAFLYCTSFYNKKVERKSGPGRKVKDKGGLDDTPSFEQSVKNK